MNLYAKGVVLGVRDGRVDRDTKKLKTQIVDMYDEASGPGQVEIDVDDNGATIPVPDKGASCTVRVMVRAYSGFVRGGQAGDARVTFKATEFIADEVATARGRRAG